MVLLGPTACAKELPGGSGKPWPSPKSPRLSQSPSTLAHSSSSSLLFSS